MLERILRIVVIYIVLAGSANAGEMVFAQKKLQILKSSGKTVSFNVEIADTTEKQEYGLMNRRKMAADHGMVFLFEKEMEIHMWMKDTYIPLDMLFIKSDNTIAKIVENTKPMSLETISSDEDVSAVLELNAGSCKKFGIEEDDRVVF